MVKKHKLMAVMFAFMMVSGALFFIANSDSSDGATVTVNMDNPPSSVKLYPGDTLKVYQGTRSSELVLMAVFDIPWMDTTKHTDEGFNVYYQGTVDIKYFTGQSYFFDAGAAGSFEIVIRTTINYIVPSNPNYNQSIDYNNKYPTLYIPESRANYTLKWYTQETGGTFVGNAGSSIINTAPVTTLYGRWEQNTVILPTTSADVYVHYRDSVSYTVDPIPANATITARWINSSSSSQNISISGKTVTLDYVELPSGTHPMEITVSASGMTSKKMTLNVTVYPQVVVDLYQYSVQPWTYEVTTYDRYDSMEIISATRTYEDNTYSINPSNITINSLDRSISYNFARTGDEGGVGFYEFTLRLVNGDAHNTTIIRVWVSDELVTGIPSCDGILAIRYQGNIYDFILQNPENYATIRWDFGDGRTETNNNTTRNHAYAGPGLYTVTVHLVNSYGDMFTVTTSADLIEPSMPQDAYLHETYIALVEVSASDASYIAVEFWKDGSAIELDWLYWEYISAGQRSYVRISGAFDDYTLVSDDPITITVSSSGVTDESWEVNLNPRRGVSVRSSFILEEVDDNTVRIKYTGSEIDGLIVQVQSAEGEGYHPYTVRSDGYMYITYDEPGFYTIVVSAKYGGIERTSSETVIISASGGGDGDDNGKGDDLSKDILNGITSYWWIILAILIATTVLLLIFGRFIPALISAAGAVIVLIWQVFL